MSITGQPDDEPGGGPQRVGVAISDITTGLYATIGILSALRHRDRTGEGQYIDLALLDTQVGWLANQASNYLTGGVLPKRTGKWHPNLAPYQPFKTSDGNIIIAVGNDNQFASLCQLIGLDDLIIDERFTTNPMRNRNRLALEGLLQKELEKHSSSYWLEQLPRAGVPASAINNIAEAFEMPQIKAREMLIELEHPLSGTIPAVANPLKFSRTPVEYRNAAPTHGADTRSVLESVLGLDQDEIEQLAKQGAIGDIT
ncbi:MAG: CaiB/BaiF CoA transferase family protein, partial [bacterium]